MKTIKIKTITDILEVLRLLQDRENSIASIIIYADGSGHFENGSGESIRIFHHISDLIANVTTTLKTDVCFEEPFRSY
jgi:hypothetical protein